MHRAGHALVLYLMLHWTEPKAGGQSGIRHQRSRFWINSMIRTPPWIWSDNAAEATLLIAFVLHSPEVTGHVPNLYNITGGKKKKKCFWKPGAKGNPAKRCCPPLFLMTLGTAWSSTYYNTTLLYLKFHFMAPVDRLKIHCAVTAVT